MATYKAIPLASIHIGDRARPVDEDHALAIAASMAERGLINPITVRATPAANKGKTPFTLVAGGHRLRGAELNEWTEIDAIVVEADAAEAQLLEISENLYRNELSKLDRAVFVLKYRELWEEHHGKIERGGDQRAKGHDGPLMFAPGKELSQRVQERLGIAERTYKRVTTIGQKLHPMLRNALRGTPYEDDQAQLLKLAKLPEAEQTGIAAALKFEPDLKKVLSLDKPKKPALAEQDVLFARIACLIEKADDETLTKVLDLIGQRRGASFLEAAQ